MGCRGPRSTSYSGGSIKTRALRFIVMLAAFLVLGLLILSQVSYFRVGVLAEGVLLMRGKPVRGAVVGFYPIGKDGVVGTPAITESKPTGIDGRFKIITGQVWRARNTRPYRLVITVDARTLYSDDLTAYVEPNTSPLKLTIDRATGEYERPTFLTIELEVGSIRRSIPQ